MPNQKIPITRTARERIPVQLGFEGAEVRTKQSFKEESDINHIMARWQRTGVIDHLAANPPTYGNFITAGDYQEACNSVIAADAAFAAMPAHIRDRMNNDPATFMNFMADPNNQAEAVKLGLATQHAEAQTVLKQTPETPAEEGGDPPNPPSEAS